jgi:uncharacterized membrane protein YdbT with pleckstrin-like domain
VQSCSKHPAIRRVASTGWPAQRKAEPVNAMERRWRLVYDGHGGIAMGYVKRVLQPEEVIKHSTGIHWIVYVPGAVMAILAFVAAVWTWIRVGGTLGLVLEWAALVLGIVALLMIFWEWFTWWTTEIAVTNRRVIYKKGFIRRKTNEMNIDKVESVQVDQSIPGRLLDYGTVLITGTGESRFDEVKRIANPIELRNCIMGQ